jgi:HemY protein
MIRLCFYIAILLLISLGMAWLLEHDGHIVLTWLNYQLDASATLVCAAIILTILIGSALFYGLFRLYYTATHAGAFYREKRKNAALLTLIQGFTALAAGNSAKASAILRTSQLRKLPIAQALRAQLAQADGDYATSSDYFNAIVSYPNENDTHTQLIALRGLVAQAYAERHFAEALRLAEKAYAINPEIKWVLQTLADLYRHKGKWQQAEEALQRLVRITSLPASEIREAKNQLSTLFLARSHDTTNDRSAYYYATQAYKSTPSLHSSLRLVTLLIKQGKRWRALRLLRRSWKQFPAPELAALFLSLYANETPAIQLAKTEAFIAVNPHHEQSHIAIARAALSAGAISKARTALRAALTLRESHITCMLMVDVEYKSFSQPAIIESWLQRALAAETAEAPHDALVALHTL